MLKRNLTYAFILCMITLLGPATLHAAFVPESKTEKAEPSKEFKKLEYSKQLSKAELEETLGRKLTGLEKTAFKINKKKFVKAMNAPSMLNADRTNTMSIIGFIFSLLIGPLGLIFSLIALRQIKQSGERGEGLAIAGIIIGALGTISLIIWLATL